MHGRRAARVGGVVDRVGRLDRAEDKLDRELLTGELPRTAVHRHASRPRLLELGFPAAGELRDHQRLLPRLPVLLPPRGLQHADQLIIRQPGHIGDRRLGQRGKHRARGQHVGRRLLGELGSEPSSAQVIQAAHRREQPRVNPVTVAEANADPLRRERPLRRGRVTACRDLPVKPRRPLIEIGARVGEWTGPRKRAGTGALAIVHLPALLPDDHLLISLYVNIITKKMVFGHEPRTYFARSFRITCY